MIFSLLQRERYSLRAEASDLGFPSLKASVNVVFDVVDRKNNPPVWDQPIYGPILIKENITVGEEVARVKAR